MATLAAKLLDNNTIKLTITDEKEYWYARDGSSQWIIDELMVLYTKDELNQLIEKLKDIHSSMK